MPTRYLKIQKKERMATRSSLPDSILSGHIGALACQLAADRTGGLREDLVLRLAQHVRFHLILQLVAAVTSPHQGTRATPIWACSLPLLWWPLPEPCPR